MESDSYGTRKRCLLSSIRRVSKQSTLVRSINTWRHNANPRPKQNLRPKQSQLLLKLYPPQPDRLGLKRHLAPHRVSHKAASAKPLAANHLSSKHLDTTVYYCVQVQSVLVLIVELAANSQKQLKLNRRRANALDIAVASNCTLSVENSPRRK